MAKEKEITVDLSEGPDPTPTIGDTVNYVGADRKIKPVKVADVAHEGRTVAIELIGEKDKKIVRVPHRPKAALAGNTWHWPSKAAALIAILAVFGLAICALAAIPTYHTAGPAYGNGTGGAILILPADPNSQIRVVSLQYTSDTNNAQLLFSSGNTAYSIQYTNALSVGDTNLIDSTNGLTAGGILVLQHNGNCYTSSVSSWGTYITGTNTFGAVTNQPYVVTASAFAIVGQANDNIYEMTTPSPWYVGTGTNAVNGDDVFSGNYGRPVIAQLMPALLTNRLNNVSSHYDSASQP